MVAKTERGGGGEGSGGVQLGDLGNAVSEWSQMLSQAIVLPLRRGELRRRPVPRPRAVALAGGATRGFTVRMRGSLFLAAGGLGDELVVELIHGVGGRKARAAILPAAAYAFAAAGERYRRSLRRFGMEHTETVEVATRAQADHPAVAAKLAGADLLVLGGGDPELLLGAIRDTAVEAALAAALVRGATVAALGPAIEAAGEWYLPAPDAEGDGAAAGPAGLHRGLGLLPRLLVAAGPNAGARVGAVFGAALTAGVQALVLDRRSTLVVRSGWQAEVRAGTVLAIGGDGEAAGRGTGGTAPLGGVYTRVAPAGWRLDLAAHVVLPPGAVIGAERP